MCVQHIQVQDKSKQQNERLVWGVNGVIAITSCGVAS